MSHDSIKKNLQHHNNQNISILNNDIKEIFIYYTFILNKASRDVINVWGIVDIALCMRAIFIFVKLYICDVYDSTCVCMYIHALLHVEYELHNYSYMYEILCPFLAFKIHEFVKRVRAAKIHVCLTTSRRRCQQSLVRKGHNNG